MGNLWSLSAVQRCSRSQNTKKMGRSSAGQKYDHLQIWAYSKSIRISSQSLHSCELFFAQVFFLQRGQNPKRGATDSAEHSRLTERIARAFCLALCPHLKLLKEDGMAKLGLRVTFDTQEVNKILLQIFQTAVYLCSYRVLLMRRLNLEYPWLFCNVRMLVVCNFKKHEKFSG